MISNVILVHGSPDNKKDKTFNQHWIPWIKRSLEKKGIKVETPLMPKAWEPNYLDWKKEFEKINIDGNSILVGHSAGGGFLVRWLGETKKKIKKLILVAPAIIHSGSYKPLDNLLNFQINSLVKNNVQEIIIFVSDNDMAGIKKSVEIFSREFKITPVLLKGKGHFDIESMGTEEFPELLEAVLE